MQIVMTVIIATIPVLIVSGIATLVVTMFKKGRSDKKVKFDFNILYGIYYYLVIFASLLILAIGASYTIKSAFSYWVEMDFSYSKQERWESKPVAVSDSETGELRYDESVEYEYDKDIQKKELIQGITMVIVSIPILILHLLGVKGVEKKLGGRGWLYKTYLIVGMVDYAIISIISLPMGVYQTLQFFLTEQSEDIWLAITPGEMFGVALSFVPIWVYYIRSYNKFLRKE